MNDRRPDLQAILDHSDPDAVLSYLRGTFGAVFPRGDFSPVENAYALAVDLFRGNFPGYLECRTGYHDLRHTLDVTVATLRLLDGCVLEGDKISPEEASETLIAALLHDAGYVQEAEDSAGTGAKYTKTHVLRSAAFAEKHAAAFRLEGAAAGRVARCILGTDLALPWDGLPSEGDGERRCMAVLAAADLLGQMADRGYLEKLLFLYFEFREAGFGGYESAFDILRKTASFYSTIRDRLDGTLGTVSFSARRHFKVREGVDADLYRDAIASQMAHLDAIMDDDSDNFRARLRRLDLEEAERAEARRLAAFGLNFEGRPAAAV